MLIQLKSVKPNCLDCLNLFAISGAYNNWESNGQNTISICSLQPEDCYIRVVAVFHIIYVVRIWTNDVQVVSYLPKSLEWVGVKVKQIRLG
jgi:hypothetical protein